MLVALNGLVHVLAARLLRMPRDAGLVTSAQLGIAGAIVALGLPLHIFLTPARLRSWSGGAGLDRRLLNRGSGYGQEPLSGFSAKARAADNTDRQHAAGG